MTKAIMRTCLGLLVSVVVSAPAMAQALDKINIVIPRNSVFILNNYGAKDAGIFEKHGIELEIDARPFGAFMAGLPAKETMVSTYAGTAAIERMVQGLDLVVIGGGLTVMQEVFVRNDAPFQSVEDLRGKRFGAWSTGAGAFKALKAVLLDAHGLDVETDTDFVEAAPPALFKFLERGDVDSMYNISSLTIAAHSQGDKFRSVFSPNRYWQEKTGYPIVWSAPIIAWRDWVEEDRDRARRFVAATHESFRWLREPENLRASVAEYGTLAAVKSEAEAKAYERLLKEKQVFLDRWDQEVVDAQWRFLDMAKQHGVLKEVPSKEKHALILE